MSEATPRQNADYVRLIGVGICLLLLAAFAVIVSPFLLVGALARWRMTDDEKAAEASLYPPRVRGHL